ncbi:hypothetical protein tinsulaeT_28860 [Thalassotalea insulae]|uniref:AAA+ ATPase domain-containing protein n=1 Tax=Thalassotalea insulae TaxID=2056778 RepID=A0ABQ6GY47_9GAMM|nr:AAA family ATPase [Thalassotalea insulae]GLX79546.1 hypothetical protein tinsulaeT_28860 [Thalassotalea insulae]
MYSAYFGLSEAPFSIAPDPAYLFMSDRHREALAHLTHGLGDHGGFVLLTGEVGTGKTTISRSVMENLPENTQSAFILNPTLSCEELLATICDNLKIRYKKTGATLKYLTDKIQDKLLKNHQNNINTLLIIDEAQHLQPQVLEQLRLLTNLETNTKKLLQVILIGQPELQQLLQRRDLRQLAQRITARYHLLPLTKAELTQYIKHRLSVAQCTRALFNKRAISELHKISKGIPRVINLLCDRALILAYGKNVTVVNSNIVKQAAIEALGDETKAQGLWHTPWFQGALAATFVVFAVLGGYWLGFNLYSEPSSTSKIAMKETIVAPVSDNSQLQAAAPKEINSQLIRLSNTDVVTSKSVSTEKVQKVEQEQQQSEPSINEKPRVLGYQPERVTQVSNDGFELVATDGVSDDLLQRFKAAVKDTETEQQSSNNKNHTAQAELKAIHQMPLDIQNSLPNLQFEMHIYATEGQGWVRVNGEDRREGDNIAQGVLLAKILPQQVVLEFHNQRFSMPALSNW